jgi:hypothetical protein
MVQYSQRGVNPELAALEDKLKLAFGTDQYPEILKTWLAALKRVYKGNQMEDETNAQNVLLSLCITAPDGEEVYHLDIMKLARCAVCRGKVVSVLSGRPRGRRYKPLCIQTRKHRGLITIAEAERREAKRLKLDEAQAEDLLELAAAFPDLEVMSDAN